MSAPAQVMVVEDEPAMQAYLCATLETAGYQCRGVASGEAALAALAAVVPDLVILDLRLAGQLTGFDVLAALRQRNQSIRVIILTQMKGEEPAIRGLELGADDYLTKGLSEPHLLARVRAQLRRPAAGASEIYRHGNIILDLKASLLICNGHRTQLGAVERKVLACLVQSAGRPVEMRELLRAGWNYELPEVFNEEDTHIVRSTVYELRRKMDGLIVTCRGVGFSLPPGEPETDEARSTE